MHANPEVTGNMEIKTVDVDGQRLRVGIRRGGDDAAPPLVVFNGIGANLELLEPFVEALGGVEVIVFDVPGVGGSPVPLMPYRFSALAAMTDRLLTKLGHAGPVDALGVSWGGALAQQFAHLYPLRCRRLVLAATSPGVIMVPAKLSVLSKMIGPRRYLDPAYLERIGADLYGGAYRRDPELLREHSRHIQAPGGRGYVYQLLAAWGWSSLPWLGSLRQPTLVMHGDDDPIVPLANAKILAARIRQSTLHVVNDGHLFVVTRAGEMAHVVREFLV
ncbi:poly(3-hydroxyalkanoate) depolymerase [Caballeronia humi]|uniref:Poly(3-hydroxyalkanoate) depolymerase n=1 Tax=Caballeronia humi TaxID=326474 RepID=A0A158HFH7_9BURK|nr:poly(3-hydroxyalkanoate) depolymerase [Caballeronia humi]SAL42721.1 Poly(3-hydroxyalkanoate) depolymerase [Caballeronia humi]